MPPAIADMAGIDERSAEAAAEIYHDEVRHRGRMNLAKKASQFSERMISPMIHVYGDDGADAKKERVIAVAVIAGTEEWWQNVEDQWIVRCGGIPFHATDCESNQGDYRNIPKEENKAMYRDLTGPSSQAACSRDRNRHRLDRSKKSFQGRCRLRITAPSWSAERGPRT
jgi:hypothetical protein